MKVFFCELALITKRAWVILQLRFQVQLQIPRQEQSHDELNGWQCEYQE
jgi:hypothetical protein